MKAIPQNFNPITENQLAALNRLANELGQDTLLCVLRSHNWILTPIDNLTKGQAGIVLKSPHKIKTNSI